MNPLHPIQHILFDVDGVTIDGWHRKTDLCKPWDKDIEKDLGIPRERFTQEFILDSFLNEVLVGKKPLLTAIKEFLPTVGFTGEAHDVIDYWNEKDANVRTDLFEHIDKLHTCENVVLSLATNQSHDRAQYLNYELGFGRYFKNIFHSAKVGHIKPTEDYLEYVHIALGAPHIPPILFDDDPKVVDAANAFGWKAYQFDTTEDIFKSPVVKKLIG